VFLACVTILRLQVLGQEQFKFVVVSETELNILKIKNCAVPMNLRCFAKEEDD